MLTDYLLLNSMKFKLEMNKFKVQKDSISLSFKTKFPINEFQQGYPESCHCSCVYTEVVKEQFVEREEYLRGQYTWFRVPWFIAVHINYHYHS